MNGEDEGFDPEAWLVAQQPGENYSTGAVYGPLVGEYGRDQMYGPRGNLLGPNDVAVSPAYPGAQVGEYGEELGDVIPTEYGPRTVADWSYYSPGRPTHNTIEFRNIRPSDIVRRGPPISQASFDPEQWLSQQQEEAPTEGAGAFDPASWLRAQSGIKPAPETAQAPPPNLPPEEANLYKILERHRVEDVQQGIYPRALPAWAHEPPLEMPQGPPSGISIPAAEQRVRQPENWMQAAEENIQREFTPIAYGQTPTEYAQRLAQPPLAGLASGQAIIEQVPQPSFIEDYYGVKPQGRMMQLGKALAETPIDVLNFLQTPAGIATLPIGELPAIGQRLIAAGFSAQQVYAAINSDDPVSRLKNLVMAGLAATGAAAGGKPALTPEEAAAAEAAARTGATEQVAPVAKPPIQVPEKMLPAPTPPPARPAPTGPATGIVGPAPDVQAGLQGWLVQRDQAIAEAQGLQQQATIALQVSGGVPAVITDRIAELNNFINRGFQPEERRFTVPGPQIGRTIEAPGVFPLPKEVPGATTPAPTMEDALTGRSAYMPGATQPLTPSALLNLRASAGRPSWVRLVDGSEHQVSGMFPTVTGEVNLGKAGTADWATVSQILDENRQPIRDLKQPTPTVPQETFPKASFVPAEPEPPPQPTNKPIEGPTMTSIANAVTDQQRIDRGFAPAEAQAARDFGSVWSEADRALQEDPMRAANLANELAAKPRPVSDLEDALLLRNQIAAETAHDMAVDEVNNSIGLDPYQQELAKARLAQARDNLQTAFDADRNAGREAGRGLNARKMAADRNLNLGRMEATLRAAKGGAALTDKEAAQVQALHDQLTDQRSKISVNDAQRAIVQAFVEQLGREAGEKLPTTKKGVVDYLGDRANEARARMRQRGGQLNFGVDPQVITDVATVGAYHIARLGRDFGQWSAQMLRDFGETIRPHLGELWNRATDLYDSLLSNRPSVPGPLETGIRRANWQQTVAAMRQDLERRGGKNYPELRIRTAQPGGTDASQQVDLDVRDIYKNEDYTKKIAEEVRPWLPKELQGPMRTHTDRMAQIERAIDFFKDNKLAHYEMALNYPWFRRAMKQYEGYNIRGHQLSSQYGFPIKNTLAGESALSPQTPPDQSFAMTERLMDVIHNHGNTRWDSRFDDAVKNKNIPIPKEHLPLIRGKTYNEINTLNVPDAVKPLLKAEWARTYDQAFNKPEYRAVTPEGTLGDIVKGKNGKPVDYAWRGFGQISRAIRILEGEAPENILKTAKVSSYYNSKIAPNEMTPDYVVDTHDIGSSWMYPVTADHPLVAQTFGGPSSREVGQHGVSALHAEAGRRAASELGLVPSDFQAGIWSHQQGFMSADALPGTAVDAIQKIWKDASRGIYTADEARARAVQIAERAIGKSGTPTWARELEGPGGPVAPPLRTAAEQGELPAPRGAERAPGGGGRGGPAERTPAPIERVANFLNGAADRARERMIEKTGRLNVGIDPTAMTDVVIVGASHIANKLVDFSKWSDRMLTDFGERIRPYLRDLYDRSKQLHESLVANAARATQLARYKAGLATRMGKLQADMEAGRFEKATRQPTQLDTEAFLMQQQYKKLRQEFESMVAQKQAENRGPFAKAADAFVSLERAIKLTGITTLGKIAGAGTTRLIRSPVENLVGSVIGRIPGLRGVAEAAPRFGRISGAAEVAALRGAGKGITEIPGVISGRIKTYETRGIPAGKYLGAPGRLHGAIKRPAWQAEYQRSTRLFTDQARRLGKDISDPQVLQSVHDAAKAEADRAIFLHDNVLSGWWNAGLSVLESSKKFPIAGPNLARLARFLLPIVRVPTNVAIEAGTMTPMGLMTATGKLIGVMRRGMENVKPEEADMIMRHYAKGAVGTGLFFLGYLNPDMFGGFYQRGQRPGPDKPGWGEAKVFGVTIPRWMLHDPAFIVLQMGATARHVMDRQKGVVASGRAILKGLGDEIPFIRETALVNSLFAEGAEGMKTTGELARGTIVPQFVQNVAAWTDEKDATGNPVRRFPRNEIDYIKLGIPGLREQVPTFRQPR